jgi:hypothetical protein
MTSFVNLETLPGAGLVKRGAADLDAGHESVEALRPDPPTRQLRASGRMRELADATRIKRFMRELGRAVDVEGLKEELDLNVELAAPSDFIPLPKGWEDRSPLISEEEKLSFHHFDPVAQALSKVERGHSQDCFPMLDSLDI